MNIYRYYHYAPLVDKYTLRIHFDHIGSDNRGYYGYRLTDKDGRVLFQGNDYSAPFWRNIIPMAEIANNIMVFLTLRPGDTDDDYFDKYTPEQLAFANSFECEALQCEVFTREERKDQRRKDG